MALNSLGLGFVFTAQNLGAATFKSVQRDLQQTAATSDAAAARIGKGMGQVKAGFILAGVGAAGLATSFALAGAAGKFEQSVAAVGAVTKATTAEMKSLEEAAVQAGIETQFSPDQAVSGLTSLATAGQNAAQATETLLPVLDLAAGSLGQLGVAGAAEAVVGTLNSYGIAAEEAGGVTDKLLRVTQLTNFQTRDFSVGLAKAAAAGSQFGQTLDDTLITVGQLRNANIDASSSATAFREAVRRLGADQNAQRQLTEKGVKVFDEQTGQMRSLIDISLDFASATENMTDKQRQQRLATAFGARGMLAFNAIQRATTQVVRDGEQVTLRGAEAIEELRRKMANAEGTAKEFKDQLLDKFEGQKTLLGGTLQTLAIVFGRPFAEIFRPFVEGITNALNAVIKGFQALGPDMQKIVAGVFVFGSAFLAAAGTLLLVQGGLALLGVILSGFVALLGGALAAVAPFALAVGGLVVAFKLVKAAFDANLGGFGDLVRGIFERVKLFFQAMAQLFSQGGFSGAVQEELSKAENQGVKGFAIRVFVLVNRIKGFFDGLIEGLKAGFTFVEPLFDIFVGALREVGEAFGFVFSGPGNPKENATAFEAFRAAGEALGRVLAVVAGISVTLIVPILKQIAAAVRVVSFVWKVLGEVFSPIANLIASTIAIIANLISGNFAKSWQLVKDLGTSAMNAITSKLLKFLSVAARVNEGIASLFGFDIDLGFNSDAPTSGPGEKKPPTAPTVSPVSAPSVAQVVASKQDPRRQEEGSGDMMRTLLQKLEQFVERPQTVSVQVDGEEIARAANNGQRSAAGRSHAPVPTV